MARASRFVKMFFVHSPAVTDSSHPLVTDKMFRLHSIPRQDNICLSVWSLDSTMFRQELRDGYRISVTQEMWPCGKGAIGGHGGVLDLSNLFPDASDQLFDSLSASSPTLNTGGDHLANSLLSLATATGEGPVPTSASHAPPPPLSALRLPHRPPAPLAPPASAPAPHLGLDLPEASPTQSYAADPDNVVEITYGSVIKLMHERTKFRLHSHDVPYGSGSGQQSVTSFPNVDDANSYWKTLDRAIEVVVQNWNHVEVMI
ncbi:hypothetical protein GUJ93_ZPchr0001g30506 [Zizania palustris]|uniref:MIR domain-containing protein n=1 Tax=Zizania palustris TaxID=103762 RepID=A0A8J5RWT5_ZIZPA|nr:hypothetical protein GUJ93_ZPchr0001g30506 [Zizania palustris]